MLITSGIRLSKLEVHNLLLYFDDSSDIPLHEGLDFDSYSEKLSKYAYFVIASENDSQVGFVAYYLNEEGKFVYIPQVVVHKDGRHKGIGHKMFQTLFDSLSNEYENVKLEVLKENDYAREFYKREGFEYIEDRGEKLLLAKTL